MSDKEKHWEASPTSYRMPRDYTDPVALTYCGNPGGTKHADGSHTISLRFPALIVTDYLSDREKVAEQLANELNLIKAMQTPRPIAEYNEDMGDVMWWAWEEGGNGLPGRWKGEPPYVGHPNCLGFEVIVQPSITLHISTGEYDGRDDDPSSDELTSKHHSFFVGGWPGYHTHFTPLPPMPNAPSCASNADSNAPASEATDGAVS